MSYIELPLPLPGVYLKLADSHSAPNYRRWLLGYLDGTQSWEEKPFEDNTILRDGRLMFQSETRDNPFYRYPLEGEFLQTYLDVIGRGDEDIFTVRGAVIDQRYLSDHVRVERDKTWIGERERPLDSLVICNGEQQGKLPATMMLQVIGNSRVDRDSTYMAECFIHDYSTVGSFCAPVIEFDHRMGDHTVHCQHFVYNYTDVPDLGEGSCLLWSRGSVGRYTHYHYHDGGWKELTPEEPLPPVTALYLVELSLLDRVSVSPDMIVTKHYGRELEELGWFKVSCMDSCSVYRRSTAKSARQVQ